MPIAIGSGGAGAISMSDFCSLYFLLCLGTNDFDLSFFPRAVSRSHFDLSINDFDLSFFDRAASRSHFDLSLNEFCLSFF